VCVQEFYAENGQRYAIHESGHVVVARYLQLPAIFEKVSAQVVPVQFFFSTVQCSVVPLQVRCMLACEHPARQQQVSSTAVLCCLAQVVINVDSLDGVQPITHTLCCW
jgi:hypothetical protein